MHKTGDVLRQWVFIGGCCDVTSIGMYTQSTRSIVWGLLGVVLYISLSVVGSHVVFSQCGVCVCVCVWGGGGGGGGGGKKERESIQEFGRRVPTSPHVAA